MRSFLIIQTASLGDVILSTSLAETLYKHYPDAIISYLIKDGYQSLFEGHPFIREVITWKKSENKYPNLFKVISKVRKRNFDAVINVQRFASSGIISALSGAIFRSGFTKNPLSFTFTHKAVHIIEGYNHEINRNLELIKPFVSEAALKPRLYPRPAHYSATELHKKGTFITISPASLYFTKQYPVHKWIEFINALPEAISVILLGSKADNKLCDEIKLKCNSKEILNLAGNLSFLESASVMEGALMNYVNDSAPQHIASAVNAPVTAIFCSTVPSFGFGPLSEKSFIVETELDLSCKPCGLHGYDKCPLGHFKCAETISLSNLLLPLSNEQRD